VAGTAFLVRGTAHVPLGGRWVVLHRVGPVTAGAVDSVRATAGGRFSFATTAARDDALFVSVEQSGITYFSDRIATAGGASELVQLAAYDTSAAAPLSLSSRHIVVSGRNGNGIRTVTELHVLLNAGTETRVSGPHSATYEAALPPDARHARAADGDVPAEAMSFAAGRVRVTAAIAPGARRVAFAYDLAADVRAVVPAPGPATDLLEVLVEDTLATVDGGGLAEQPPSAGGGRVFRRFLANTVPAGATVTIELPARAADASGVVLVASVVLAAAALGVVLVRSLRRNGPPLAEEPSLAAPSGEG
jgi:hypothetical protein